jgi:hypothetical protein
VCARSADRVEEGERVIPMELWRLRDLGSKSTSPSRDSAVGQAPAVVQGSRERGGAGGGAGHRAHLAPLPSPSTHRCAVTSGVPGRGRSVGDSCRARAQGAPLPSPARCARGRSRARSARRGRRGGLGDPRHCSFINDLFALRAGGRWRAARSGGAHDLGGNRVKRLWPGVEFELCGARGRSLAPTRGAAAPGGGGERLR